MIKSLAYSCGIMMVLIGVLGFIPGIATNDNLFNFFHVNAFHNLLHIFLGIIFCLCGWLGADASRLVFQIVGTVYIPLGLLGVYYESLEGKYLDETLLSHVVIALFFVVIGFGSSPENS